MLASKFCYITTMLISIFLPNFTSIKAQCFISQLERLTGEAQWLSKKKRGNGNRKKEIPLSNSWFKCALIFFKLHFHIHYYIFKFNNPIANDALKYFFLVFIDGFNISWVDSFYNFKLLFYCPSHKESICNLVYVFKYVKITYAS